MDTMLDTMGMGTMGMVKAMAKLMQHLNIMHLRPMPVMLLKDMEGMDTDTLMITENLNMVMAMLMVRFLISSQKFGP